MNPLGAPERIPCLSICLCVLTPCQVFIIAGDGQGIECDRIFVRNELLKLIEEKTYLAPLIVDSEVFIYAPCTVVSNEKTLVDRCELSNLIIQPYVLIPHCCVLSH